jgi:hypothetical protein
VLSKVTKSISVSCSQTLAEVCGLAISELAKVKKKLQFYFEQA